MNELIETAMVLLILTNLALLGFSRLGACIRAAAFQGVLAGALTLFLAGGTVTARIAALALASVALKGFVFPWLLRRAIREAEVQREVEPFVDFVPSILAGVVMLVVASWLGARIAAGPGAALPLVKPAAFMTLFTGLFLVITRRKALTQVLGYLVFENGIYVFGVAAVGEVPALVELGVLLDAFVAVFVMGIAILHINREFDHIDADQLSALKG